MYRIMMMSINGLKECDNDKRSLRDKLYRNEMINWQRRVFKIILAVVVTELVREIKF